MATSTELSDVLLSAFDARRRLLTRWGEGGLVLAGDDDGDMHRLREFAERNHVPYRTVLRSDPSAWSEVAATCALPEKGTAVVTGRGRILTQPTTRDLAAAVGLDLSGLSDQARCDLLIVGAGPAGLAAAVYGASEGLDVVIAEDVALGGQAGTSSRIENYLGFPRGIAGSELARSAMLQAVKFGARLVSPRSVTSLSRNPDGFQVRLDDHNDVAARAVVVASGVQYRRLEIQMSLSSRVAASTTPRLNSKREHASARTWSWWEAPTRPGKPRCSSRSMSTTCTSSFGVTTSPRPCPAISRKDSLTMTGSPSTLGHT
jgi:thioredoxin reductase (NADPH)